MIPGYKISCKKVNINLLTTTYELLHAQIVDADGKVQCIFCKAPLDTEPPVENYYSYITCYECNYSISFDKTRLISSVAYKGAAFRSTPNDKKTISVEYTPSSKYKLSSAAKAKWTTSRVEFTLKGLLNEMNSMDLQMAESLKKYSKDKPQVATQVNV